MSKNPWQKISSKVVYKNQWVTLREDQVIRPDGKEGIYSVFELAPSVFIIALTEQMEMYMIYQYRYPTGILSWEIPAGSSEYQDPAIAAKRELQEETGLIADKWTFIGEFQSLKGVATEIGNVFIAQGVKMTDENKIHEDGIKSVKKFPIKKVLEMIKTNEISDCQTMAALHMACLHLGIYST